MPTLNTTPNRAYQEPFPGNDLATDVGRIISALRAIDVDIADAFAQIVGKASLASPALTGTPTAPTAVAGTQTNQLATTAFVAQGLAALVGMAPDALDTIEELAAKAEDNSDLIDLLEAAVAAKADAAATLAALALKQNTTGEYLRGHIRGLTLSNNATDATNDIDIAVGSAASDGATPSLMTLAAALTKRLDAAWAVGTGNGGLDTGTIANTTYHVWLIQRSDTGVVDAIFSTSATSPTMPASYDRKRRIGAIIRKSGSIVGFSQIGDRFILSGANLTFQSNSTRAGSPLPLLVPTGVPLLANIAVATISTAGNVLIVSGDDFQCFSSSSATYLRYEIVAQTNASGEITVGTTGTPSGTNAWQIYTKGWVDYTRSGP